jgi:hypothetical protein
VRLPAWARCPNLYIYASDLFAQGHNGARIGRCALSTCSLWSVLCWRVVRSCQRPHTPRHRRLFLPARPVWAPRPGRSCSTSIRLRPRAPLLEFMAQLFARRRHAAGISGDRQAPDCDGATVRAGTGDGSDCCGHRGLPVERTVGPHCATHCPTRVTGPYVRAAAPGVRCLRARTGAHAAVRGAAGAHNAYRSRPRQLSSRRAVKPPPARPMRPWEAWARLRLSPPRWPSSSPALSPPSQCGSRGRGP